MKIRFIETDKDIGTVANLISGAHHGVYTMRQFQMYIKSPTFRREYTRLGEIDGEIVSFGMIIPQDIRIGSSVVRGGWINFGTTKVESRGKGIFPTLVKNMMESQKDWGYHLTMSYGRAKPYFRFGGVPCFYRSMVYLYTKDIKKIRRPYRVRKAELKDAGSISDLYNLYLQKRTSCYFIRPIYFWKTVLQYHPS